MRLSPRLFATAASIGSKSSLTEAVALLPPLHLYRRILRIHRKKLQHQLRVLGDSYVKKEFRAHQDWENPLHIIGFLTEWQLYAQKLAEDSWQGEKLDKDKLDRMQDQQLVQLAEMLNATKGKDGKDK